MSGGRWSMVVGAPLNVFRKVSDKEIVRGFFVSLSPVEFLRSVA